MKETLRSHIFSWVTIDGYKKNEIFTIRKKFLCSFNGPYNPFIEKKIFLQSNKNLIPLMGYTTQSRENK